MNWPARAFLLASLLLGGAGLSNPLANGVIVLLGLLVLAQRLPPLAWRDLDPSARMAMALLAAGVILCLLQMVPLPRGVWAALPGHAAAAQVAEVAGGRFWTAWSLAPDRTFDALTALVPVAAALLIAAQASAEKRLKLLRLVLAVALGSAALAVVQIGLGPNSAPVLYDSAHRGFGIGLFVNRNHFALFLLVAMQIAALPGVPAVLRKVENARAAEWGLRTGALALLALGVVSSLSRTGILLLPVALAAAILLSWRGRVRLPVLAGGVAVAALLGFALRAAPPVQMLLARFATTTEDKRFQFWANTFDALRDALPMGTGLGTFTLIYPMYEPVNEVYVLLVNHAHSDVLELGLEAGVAGFALLLAWLAFVALAVVAARKRADSRRDRLLPLAVAIATVLALAASLVDYPMRMHAMAVAMALLVGMPVPVRKPETAAAPPSRLRRGLIWALLLLVALPTASGQVGLHLVRQGDPLLAARVAPWSSLVQSAAATRHQLMADPDASSRAARRALALAPLDAQALRAEGMAALALGRREQGAALLSLGGRLGWRDTLTQLWLAEQALAAGANGFAVQRMDAVLRQEQFGAELLPLMPGLMRTADGRAGLADQLAFQPGWRVAFFNAVARDGRWTMPQLLDLAARLRRTEAPMTASDTALIRAFLAGGGRYGDARRVWLASGERALIGDGGFETRAGPLPPWQGPYAWWAPPLTGVRLDVAKANLARLGQALAITSDGLAPGGALAQTVVLAPGRYAIAFSAEADAEDAALLHELGVAVACRRDTGTALGPPIPAALTWRAGRDGWQHAQGRFAVPVDCPGQTVTLVIPQTGGRPFSLWVDDVSIRAAE